MSAEILQQLKRDFKHLFTRIGWFDGTFSLQVKPDSKPCQAPLRHVAYALQKPFKEDLEWLQLQDIITLLGMDVTAEWCNSFALVPKTNWKVKVCLDPARLNQALIRVVHRGLSLNDILLKLNNAQYHSLIDVFWLSQPKPRWKIIIPHNICTPIWQIQIQVITIWSRSCRK